MTDNQGLMPNRVVSIYWRVCKQTCHITHNDLLHHKTTSQILELIPHPGTAWISMLHVKS